MIARLARLRRQLRNIHSKEAHTQSNATCLSSGLPYRCQLLVSAATIPGTTSSRSLTIVGPKIWVYQVSFLLETVVAPEVWFYQVSFDERKCIYAIDGEEQHKSREESRTEVGSEHDVCLMVCFGPILKAAGIVEDCGNLQSLCIRPFERVNFGI